MRLDINDYKLVLENTKASTTSKEANDVHFERDIKVGEEDLLLQRNLL